MWAFFLCFSGLLISNTYVLIKVPYQRKVTHREKD